MPTQIVWIEPEQFLEHRGVRVLHTYKEDDWNQGVKKYWFTVNSKCGVADSLCDDEPCRHVFDVRALPTWQPPAQPPYCCGADDTPENRLAWQRYWELEEAAVKAALTAAIDRGELSASGCSENLPPQPLPKAGVVVDRECLPLPHTTDSNPPQRGSA
ncbi:MAG: hypothetical protein ACYDH9_26855 [Limisphaerales bacterium]